MSKISIIVPVYNVERFLDRCINSILSQTHSDLELILINDGSSDSSGGICDRYSSEDNRIRVINKDNGGVSLARNKGLELASGDYICFVDSDDWVDSSFLEDFCVDKFDADIYYSGALCDIDNKTYSCKKYKLTYIDNRESIGAEFFRQELWQNGYPWGKLYKASIIKDNNMQFCEGLNIHEDHIFLFEYLSHIESVYIADTAGYHYLVMDGTNRKLSSKINSYNDLLMAGNKFDIILKSLYDNLSLTESEFNALSSSFTINCRIIALYNIFYSKGEANVRYENFKTESSYWRSFIKTINDYPISKFNKIIISIIARVRFLRLSYVIIYFILILKRIKKSTSTMKYIKKDLQSRGDVV